MEGERNHLDDIVQGLTPREKERKKSCFRVLTINQVNWIFEQQPLRCGCACVCISRVPILL
jgi:hypothetical protein